MDWLKAGKDGLRGGGQKPETLTGGRFVARLLNWCACGLALVVLIGVVRYFGTAFLLIAAGVFFAGWFTTKVFPRLPGEFRVALSLQVGKMLTFAGVAVLGYAIEWTDILVMLVLVLWLGLRPSLWPAILLVMYNTLSVVVAVCWSIEVWTSSAVGGLMWNLATIIALAAGVRGYTASRTRASRKDTEPDP